MERITNVSDMPLPEVPPPGPICRECGLDHGTVPDPMGALIECLGKAVERAARQREAS